LARPLPSERLCLGQRLVAVIDRGDHVELHLRRGDASVSNADSEAFSDTVSVLARRLVLALPPRVLDATVSFEPELPVATRQAMVATATWMACAAKAGFVYPHAFWRDNGHTGNAWVSHRQAMLGQVFDACGPIVRPTVDRLASGVMATEPAAEGDTDHGAALAGFAAIRAVQRPGFALSRDLLLLSQMVQLFGPQADDPAHPPELFWHDWATEPETCSPADLTDDGRGAGAHPHYGDPALSLPLWGGRLFLAGTETAGQGGGYLEGALVAAARVRRQLAALNDA
jgi:monoamine oxidase